MHSFGGMGHKKKAQVDTHGSKNDKINLYLPWLNKSPEPRGNSWCKLLISTVIMKHMLKIYTHLNKRTYRKIITILEIIIIHA